MGLKNMERKRLNTTLSGYHLLMILSAVDFRFHPKEDLVIKDFLVSEFPFTIDLDKQMEVISRLLPDEWEAHFDDCMYDFELEGTVEEKTKVLDFAVQLIKADDIITKEENMYVNKLFNAWMPE
jgi:hypothetical protein